MDMLMGILIAIATSVNIYHWVDDKGTLHYSDRLRPSAAQLIVSEPQTFTLSQVTLDFATQMEEVIAYEALVITQPEHEATIRHNLGTVTVTIAVQPALIDGHRVLLLLDDQPIESTQQSLHFNLTHIDRGEHRLLAQIIDCHDQVLISSEPIVFYLHRAIVNS